MLAPDKIRVTQPCLAEPLSVNSLTPRAPHGYAEAARHRLAILSGLGLGIQHLTRPAKSSKCGPRSVLQDSSMRGHRLRGFRSDTIQRNNQTYDMCVNSSVLFSSIAQLCTLYAASFWELRVPQLKIIGFGLAYAGCLVTLPRISRISVWRADGVHFLSRPYCLRSVSSCKRTSSRRTSPSGLRSRSVIFRDLESANTQGYSILALQDRNVTAMAGCERLRREIVRLGAASREPERDQK